MDANDPLFIPGDRIYREHILDHYKHPRNYGPLPKATLSARAKNPLCGDTITIHLKVEKGKIVAIHFEGQGCAISTAAASLLTERVVGKTLASVERLSSKDILQDLGVPLGPVRLKCALLSLSTVKDAIATYRRSST
jgi:nitrogen fixation NifU-like protein